MPTVAELQIVLEAQDRASAQLQQVGAQVQRLQIQVESAQRRGGGGGLLGALTGGLGIGAGMRAIEGAIGGIGGVITLVGESIFGMNSRLERATAQFRIFAGSASEAQRIITELRREADVTPFSTDEVIRAGAALSTVARAANVDLLELVRTSEALAASAPEQGLEGAVFALREAVLGGDFQSIIDRFNLSRATINRLREEGVPALRAVQIAMREVGATSEQLEAFGRTFEGRASTIRSFFDELRQRLGAGIFERVSELFGHLVNLISTYGDALRRLASDIGAALGVIAERIAQAASGPLRAFLDLFAPGLWQSIQAELDTVPQALEQTTQAAQQAAPAVESVSLQLARVGVAAAGLQLEADRVRRAYDDQLAPLQRQLRLLQQSADLQRVQSALATNRATVEGIRLQQEVTALQRAARGAEDPNAPGLTVRQRALALALQERRLRQEELGITERQRPAIQTLEQQIASIQEQQRQALEPLERQLALYRDQADSLKLVRDQTELNTQADRERADVIRDTGRGPATPEALEDSRKRGEAVVQRFLDGYQKWLDANGGNLWNAVIVSYNKWLDAGGREQLAKMGADIARIIADAIGATFGELLRSSLFPQGFPRFGGPGSGPGSQGSPYPTVNDLPPEYRGDTVSVNVGGIQIGHQGPGLEERFKQALTDFVRHFFASEAATDPGASPNLQGAGRAP